ncbi:DUF3800 domain-containing protein [Bradyrhizobium sp. 157]|uniref:DUF3800 domain-containing protein n=1 Tax=Bradyrhizobium sp. 157 TaxID=2782631 RepID=UPI003208973F
MRQRRRAKNEVRLGVQRSTLCKFRISVIYTETVFANSRPACQLSLRGFRSLGSLDFIEGFPSNLLIDEFSTFYRGRIATFKYSSHILDLEDTIRDQLLKTPLTSNGKPVKNFRFVDPKAEPGIQLSDVVVGLLGKMHTYLANAERDEDAADRETLSGPSLENANLLRDLLSASHEANIAFLNHVASVHDLDKLDLLLRFANGEYAT